MRRALSTLIILIFLWVGIFPLWPALAQTNLSRATINITASDAKIRTYEKRLETLEKEKTELSRDIRKLRSQLGALSKDISKLKAQKDRGFFANARLQRLLANHLEISQKLEKIESNLQINREQRLNLKNKLRQVYDSKISQIVQSLTREKDRGKQIHLVHEYFRFQERAKRLKASSGADRSIGDFSIELDPLDGPREITEKINMLQDRVSRLEMAILQIDKEIARLKEKRALAVEMRQIMEERNLFEDGVRFSPSPRTLPVRTSPGQDGSSGSDSGYDEAKVHTSPVSGEGSEGGAYNVGAIDKEISRLEREKIGLEKIITGLKKKIKLFKSKVKEVSG